MTRLTIAPGFPCAPFMTSNEAALLAPADPHGTPAWPPRTYQAV